MVVGDRVTCERDENGDHAIVAVEPRRNYVIRRASNLSKESHIIAANIDQALLMVTLRQPETAPEFVDRFLVTCEAYKVPAVIVLSKADVQEPEALAAFRAVYENGNAGTQLHSDGGGFQSGNADGQEAQNRSET